MGQDALSSDCPWSGWPSVWPWAGLTLSLPGDGLGWLWSCLAMGSPVDGLDWLWSGLTMGLAGHGLVWS
jgi:hypothetical protein